MTGVCAWNSVATYLDCFATYYPGIATWAAKVRNGLPTRERSVFAFVSSTGALAGLAITKNQEDAKLCHISVAESAREDGLGARLMYAAVQEMLTAGARRIHVTTSEEVATHYGEFFERFGFHYHSFCRSRYRRGADEFEWQASRERVASQLWSQAQLCAAREYAGASLMRLRWIGGTSDLAWIPVHSPSAPSCLCEDHVSASRCVADPDLD